MFYQLKQHITKLVDSRPRLDFEKGLSLRGSSRNLGLSLYTLGFLAAIVGWQPVNAQTFDQASTERLRNDICFGDLSNVGAQLNDICINGYPLDPRKKR